MTAGIAIWAAALLAPLVAVALPLMDFGNVPATSLHPSANPFWVNLIKYDPLLHLPDFCVGIVTGRVYQFLRSSGNPMMGRGYWLYGPGLLLEMSAILTANSIPYPLIHNGLLLPVHSVVILGLALGGGTLAKSFSTRPFVFLGNASYSMYVLHAPAGNWIGYVHDRLFSTKLAGLGVTMLYVILVVCLASIVFKIIEEPANRMLKRRLGSWLDRRPKEN